MSYSERNLPHWHPEGKALFITWRLHGCMPSSDWGSRKDARTAFREMDRALDEAARGPVWLKDPRVAKIVIDALRFCEGNLNLFELIAFAIMANHVHILIQPKAELSKITRAIKGFTAREANKILHRTGKPFWQVKSFDRWVRNEEEFNKIIRYIEGNPVSAGLAARIEDYPWSSAFVA